MRKSLCSAAAGFLAAAVVPTVVLSVSVPFTGTRFDLEGAMVELVLFFPFAVASVVTLGIPTFLILRPFAPGEWWIAVAVGLVLAVPLRYALQLILPGKGLLPDPLVLEPLTTLSALVFWLVWRWVEERERACCPQ